MPYTYPPAAPTLTGDVLSISRFLNSPTLVQRRLRTLLEQRYIADALLSQRFRVEGGAVVYETGESIFTADNPRAVSPGGEYPLTGATTGAASVAKTAKWGQDTEVTDESIRRQGMNPVERAFTKLTNQNVKYVDSVALSAIATAVTATQAVAAAWSGATAEQIMFDVADVVADIRALNMGYEPDTVALDDVLWARAMSKFVAAGLTPRETRDTALLTGDFPTILGMKWLATPNIPTAGVVLVVDSTQLGGMADEDLGGPGYVGAGPVGVETKSIREDKRDQWRLRCRRVTVPVVTEPAAGKKLTGA